MQEENSRRKKQALSRKCTERVRKRMLRKHRKDNTVLIETVDSKDHFTVDD